MTIKKPKKPIPKRPSPRKARPAVDPARLALAAIERIKTALTRAGHGARVGSPVTMRELVLRGNVLEQTLPPSYVAALRNVSSIGLPERLLSSTEMHRGKEQIAQSTALEPERYVPFAEVSGRYLCFDKENVDDSGELPVFEWGYGTPRPRYANFAEWLDDVADAREEALQHAAVIPPRLRSLLFDLGFHFEYPVVGRLETGDVTAIEQLVGKRLAREVRGGVDRLFDSSGKASLTLNVDEFTLAVSLRTGIFVFEAEDVFRWLRQFRDENFFGDMTREPAHADNVRDLRKATREAPLVLRGVSELSVLPAQSHEFRAATGKNADDFYILGRTSSTKESSPSLILHVVGGQIREAHTVDEPLTAIHSTPDGTTWGLSSAGTALRFIGDTARVFSLVRPSHGRTWWYGIGGDERRTLVWGRGALLAFDGDAFSSFSPDAGLNDNESITALSSHKSEIAMLVCGDHVGAVACFDGRKWLTIPESHVIQGSLADLDLWRGTAVVLGRDGHIWRAENGQPRLVLWDSSGLAFLNQGGATRPTHAIRCHDGGMLLASDGGVIALGGTEPVFYSAGQTQTAARLARVGSTKNEGIVAMIGPHVWVWRSGAFQVLDLREW